ncbi:MAG: glycosyltransferase [Ktedonobacteraceae bacterium]|nr:glycosyltransferase [Ktedonobacteraceae bacterium]
MNLLMVSPHLPDPSWGAGTRSYHLLKALAREHTVSLLALTDGTVRMSETAIPGLASVHQVVLPASRLRKRAQQLMSILRGRSYLLDFYFLEEVQRELDSLFAAGRYDAVLFESVFMAGYRLPAGLPAIIDQHNIEYELLQRTFRREKNWLRKWYNWWESRMLKPVELERCRKAQAILVTSERECFLLKGEIPQGVIEVVPNGVDIESFSADGEQQEVVHRLVFTGTMNYYPNIDAVLFFVRECWPLIRSQVPDATWHIVGKSPPPEVVKLAELPGVTVTGAVPDVRPYLAQAAVAIVPLLIGSGTRLKILEALAMRKAVVSTSLGCEGLTVTPGEHLVVADQPENFARAVVDLLQHTEKRVALGNAGRALVEASYSWQQCGESVIRTLEKVMR